MLKGTIKLALQLDRRSSYVRPTRDDRVEAAPDACVFLLSQFDLWVCRGRFEIVYVIMLT